MLEPGQDLINRSSFSKTAMGAHALVRAMVESHTRVAAACPGVFAPDMAAAVSVLPETDRPFAFELFSNEKIVTKTAFRAALSNSLACAVYGGAGPDLDTFWRLVHLELPGGLVMVLPDDPDAGPSGRGQAICQICLAANVAVLTPATPKDAYLGYKTAARLAATHKTVVVLKASPELCLSSEKISFSGYDPGDKTGAGPDNGCCISLLEAPPEKNQADSARFERITKDLAGLNRVIQGGGNKGIIASGRAFLQVMDAIKRVPDPPSVLKLMAVHPLDRDLLKRFLAGHEEVLVIEETEDMLEVRIKAIAFDMKSSPKILGKAAGRDDVGEFTRPRSHDAPVRAVMCPECGFRPAAEMVAQALADNDLAIGEMGCHTFEGQAFSGTRERLMCAGASPGDAAGISMGTPDRKILACIGDAAFFHSGVPERILSGLNRDGILLLLLTGKSGDRQSDCFNEIPDLACGPSIDRFMACDPFSRERLAGMIRTALAAGGTSVVTACHPALPGQTRNRQKARDAGIAAHLTPEYGRMR